MTEQGIVYWNAWSIQTHGLAKTSPLGIKSVHWSHAMDYTSAVELISFPFTWFTLAMHSTKFVKNLFFIDASQSISWPTQVQLNEPQQSANPPYISPEAPTVLLQDRHFNYCNTWMGRVCHNGSHYMQWLFTQVNRGENLSYSHCNYKSIN